MSNSTLADLGICVSEDETVDIDTILMTTLPFKKAAGRTIGELLKTGMDRVYLRQLSTFDKVDETTRYQLKHALKWYKEMKRKSASKSRKQSTIQDTMLKKGRKRVFKKQRKARKGADSDEDADSDKEAVDPMGDDIF